MIHPTENPVVAHPVLLETFKVFWNMLQREPQGLGIRGKPFQLLADALCNISIKGLRIPIEIGRGV